MKRKTTALVGSVLALVATLSGCSTKGGSGAEVSTDNTGVKSGVGVTKDTITLGQFSDLSGPFKISGVPQSNGVKIWASEVNAAGGICGRDIKIDVRDTAYQADKAVTMYPELQGSTVGLVQMGGAAVIAALKSQTTQDKIVSVITSWSSEFLGTPGILEVGASYDIQMVNAMAWMQKQDMIADGDNIGHIYVESDYGSNALLGSTYYAQKHGQTIKEVKVTGTNIDMSAAVTKLKSDGVKAILLSTTPAQTASAASTAASIGLDVPLMGNNAAFDPTSLNTPAGPALEHSFYMSSPLDTLGSGSPAATKLAETYKTQGFTDTPNNGLVIGYLVGHVWGAVLQKACDDKDLTRDGVLQAALSLDDVDTQGLTGKLDYSNPGVSSGMTTSILKADSSKLAGLRIEAPFTDPPKEVTGYPFPHAEAK